MKTQKSAQLEKFDRSHRGPDTFKNASKQPWECESYEEFVASLPENEQPDYGGAFDGFTVSSDADCGL